MVPSTINHKKILFTGKSCIYFQIHTFASIKRERIPCLSLLDIQGYLELHFIITHNDHHKSIKNRE